MFFLVVDDDVDIASRNCEFLRQWQPDCRTLAVETPDAALRELELRAANLPDLIVSDLWYRIGLNHTPKPGKDLLLKILQDFPTLNVLVYTSDPQPLMTLLDLIDDHEGGFAIADKIKEGRAVFLDRAKQAVAGEIKVYRKLKDVQQNTNLKEIQREILRLACEECLRDSAIAERMHLHPSSIIQKIRTMKDKLISVDYDEKDTDTRMLLCREAKNRGFVS